MNEKVIFFDIDGTLVGFDGKLPESAVRAIERAKKRGHRFCLCTGRSKCQLQRSLEKINFDGMVCAAGAYVEYEGNILCRTEISVENLRKLVAFFEREQIVYALQSTEHIIMTSENQEKLLKMFSKIVPSSKESLGEELANPIVDDRLFENLASYRHVEKATYHDSPLTPEEVRYALASEFEVTEMSYHKDYKSGGEVSVIGINKSYGMKRLLEAAGVRKEDTIAFGDGTNDLDMLRFADIGVAMGNAGADVQECADMVTETVENDGIYLAMARLGLI